MQPLVSIPINQQLAIKRTELANDRTFLASVRTTLSFLAGSLALWKVFSDDASNYVAVFVAFISVFVFAIGTWKYQQTKAFIERTKQA